MSVVNRFLAIARDSHSPVLAAVYQRWLKMDDFTEDLLLAAIEELVRENNDLRENAIRILNHSAQPVTILRTAMEGKP